MKTRAMLLLAAILLAASSAFAGDQTTSSKFPFVIGAFVPCANGGAGDFVSLSGNLHTVFTTNVNDNNVHLAYHFQPQGVSGTGTPSGDKYQATGVTRSNENFSVRGFPFETTYVNNFRIIGQGPGNNFLVHENLHVTINADGSLTAFHDNFSFDCK